MEVSHQEISELENLIFELNSIRDSVIVVEGRRDREALRNLGSTSEIIEFHNFGGMAKFADYAANYKNLIVLFDFDKKGKHLTRKTIEYLQRRTKINTSYKKQLISITKGKIRAIEELDTIRLST